MRSYRGRSLSILYILALAALLVIPLGNTHIEQIDVSGFRGDYVVHFLVYIPWVYLGRLIFAERFKVFRWVVIGIIFVAMMEFAQYLIPYRGYNINDLIAGEIGILISLITYSVVKRFIPS